MSNTKIEKELGTIRTMFDRLAASFARVGLALAAQAERSATSSTNGSGRKKPNLSTKQRTVLKLQGKYMGTMRGLPASKHSQVTKIRARQGIRAAIQAAERMAGWDHYKPERILSGSRERLPLPCRKAA